MQQVVDQSKQTKATITDRVTKIKLYTKSYVELQKEADSLKTEIEDVKGHLKGGVPLREVEVYTTQYQKFDFDYQTLLKQRDEEYLLFKDDSDVKDKITQDENVSTILTTYQNHLNSWWSEAKDEFSKLQETKNINKVKSELLESFKDYFEPLQTLDRFQTSGVFVEWWNSIKYDLKTISSIGFNESLLSDEMLIEAFFQDEKKIHASLSYYGRRQRHSFLARVSRKKTKTILNSY
jgi:type I restriction enzyme M protein